MLSVNSRCIIVGYGKQLWGVFHYLELSVLREVTLGHIASGRLLVTEYVFSNDSSFWLFLLYFNRFRFRLPICSSHISYGYSVAFAFLLFQINSSSLKGLHNPLNIFHLLLDWTAVYQYLIQTGWCKVMQDHSDSILNISVISTREFIVRNNMTVGSHKPYLVQKANCCAFCCLTCNRLYASQLKSCVYILAAQRWFNILWITGMGDLFLTVLLFTLWWPVHNCSLLSGFFVHNTGAATGDDWRSKSLDIFSSMHSLSTTSSAPEIESRGPWVGVSHWFERTWWPMADWCDRRRSAKTLVNSSGNW